MGRGADGLGSFRRSLKKAVPTEIELQNLGSAATAGTLSQKPGAVLR